MDFSSTEGVFFFPSWLYLLYFLQYEYRHFSINSLRACDTGYKDSIITILAITLEDFHQAWSFLY